MKQYLNILQKEIPKITVADLYVPISNTHIDSIDLVVIRVTLEKYFKIDIPDIIWYKYQTLNDAIQYFHSNNNIDKSNIESETQEFAIFENIEIRMPQMANEALSENWLLRYLGDIHWQLLSKGFEKKSSEFKDEAGKRLYATFIRVKYVISPLTLFLENDIIEFKSSIKGYGNNTFLSEINGNCENKTIGACLMTTFSIREKEDNNKISKCEPKLKSNLIKQLSKTPMFLNDYRLLKKRLIDDITTNYGVFHITDDYLFYCEYEINPYSDINGVGLLYFASYPIIADICFLKYNPQAINYQTIYRDIFYLANCNSSDTIIFKINTIEEDELRIKTLISLYRTSDNQLLARIFTVKQKSE